MLMGAWIGAKTWVPLRIPVFPALIILTSYRPLRSAALPPSQPADAVPRTAADTPHRLIGAWIGAKTWVPLRIPVLSALIKVVSAYAAVPVAMTAPAVSAPALSERRTHVFIVEGTSFDRRTCSDRPIAPRCG